MTIAIKEKMNTEIERKYLVVSDAFRQQASAVKRIRQGYLSVDPERTIRVRQSDNDAYLTIKAAAPEGSIARFEWEKSISVEDFEALFAHCLPGAIEKERYIVLLNDGLKAEVDVFHGANEGLILAEIELPHEDTKVVLPDFLGEEVTADERYYNSYLIQHPYAEWKND